ncbi:FlgD immunoglobulin-like domain containing protein, partial [Candidatus Eisenbacteria bacterium]
KIFGYNAFDLVQDGIDNVTGSTVNIAAGDYEEQLEISQALTLDGAGKGVTTVQSPASLSKYFTTGTKNNYPVIYVHDSDGVTVKDMTVDGLSRGNTNYRFEGVAYYNAGGTIDNCEIKDIKDTPISGAQHGVAIYAYTDIATARTLNISGCDVYGYQKNGMALIGEYLTVNVDGCVVTGYGPAPLGLAAQNGIQLSGATGTIGVTSANTISGNSYVPHDWAATGIMLYGTSGNVQVKNNILTENSECLYCYNTSATIENNTVTVTQAGTGVADCWAMICDPGSSGRRPVQAFDDLPQESKGGGEGILTSFSYTVNGNTIDGDDGLYSVGLDIWCGGTDNLTFSGSNNQVSDFDYGVLITEGSAGAVTSVNLTSNTISSNVTCGLYNAVTGLVAYSNQFYGNGLNAQDDGASANQWNHSSCPGNYWDDYVSNSGYPGQYNLTGTAGSIDDCPLSIGLTLDPATHLMACGETITYEVNVGSNALDLMGADYKISYDDTKLSLVSVTVGDLLNTGVNEYIFTYQTGTGVIHINSAHMTTGVNGPGTIAEITFQSTGSTSPASTALTFSDTELRDSGNQTLPGTWTGASVVIDCVDPTISVNLDAPVSPWTCYNTAPTVDISASDDYDLDCVSYDIDGGGYTDITCGITGTSWTATDWTLPGFAGLGEGSHTYSFKAKDDAGNESTVASVTFTKDTIAPSAVTDFVATVGHNQIVLDWTNPGGDVDRIYLYRNDWTDYPVYGVTPGDPGYPTVGGYDVQTNVGTVETYTDGFSNTTRGIYAYRAVVYDCAGNYASAGSDDHDRATSYYLGDIASSAGLWIPNYDGVVDGFDYNPFSGCYWLAPPTGSCMETDFGPTIEPLRGSFGIPQPDSYVGFEDLMIFAINYGSVPPPSPALSPLPGVELASAGMAEASGVYRLSLKEVSRVDGVVELALIVEGNELFKGLSAEIEYDGGLEFVSAMPSEALLGGSRVLFMGGEVDGVVRVDFAALGLGVAIGGNGPVATLSFQTSSESGSSVQITSADARDVENNVLILEFDGGASIDPGMPAMFALRGNSPNPFAGSTEIRFDVPRDARVSLRIYNIQGQIVQTLVDGAVSAGRHAETWDGLDSQGRKVSAGVYFCEMQSGSFVATHKLMISR